MREDGKEVFTRREIEIDLKNIYKNLLSWTAIIFLFVLLMDIIIACVFINAEQGKMGVVFVFSTIIAAINIATIVAMCYFICNIFALPEYKIVSDTYLYESTKTILFDGLSCFNFLHFKTYGRFGIDYGRSAAAEAGFPSFEGRWFYKWSATCKTNTTGIRQSSFPGDEFYLVIIKNKIKYVYNKKIFEFKETNEKA